MPNPRPPSATNCPMAPSPKMPSVDPRSRCDSVHGHSPRFMRSASSATLRREATIKASASSAGASGELLLPAVTGMPSAVQAAKSIACELRPTSAINLSFGSCSSSARENSTRSLIDTTTSASRRRSTSAVRSRCRLPIAGDVVMVDQRETRELIDHVLVVVGNDNLHRTGWLSSHEGWGDRTAAETRHTATR